MVMKKYTPNQIFVFDDVISDKDCDEIIKVIEKYATKKTPWAKYNNVECYPIYVDEIGDKELSKKIDDKIFKTVNNLAHLFLNEYSIPCKSDSGYILRKIVGPTREHVDGILVNPGSREQNINKNLVRNMSLIIALNGDYEGGEFVFPQQNNHMVKLKRGQVICFPPYWTHPHKTNPLSGNTVRYTINTWLCGT